MALKALRISEIFAGVCAMMDSLLLWLAWM